LTSAGVDEHAARHVAVDLELEDRRGVRLGLLGRVGELHAAGLHAAAGQDLRLDDDRAADLLGDRLGLLGVGGEAAFGDRDPGALDDLARLVLEEPHSVATKCTSPAPETFGIMIWSRCSPAASTTSTTSR
jgi:hypothetical protein